MATCRFIIGYQYSKRPAAMDDATILVLIAIFIADYWNDWRFQSSHAAFAMGPQTTTTPTTPTTTTTSAKINSNPLIDFREMQRCPNGHKPGSRG